MTARVECAERDEVLSEADPTIQQVAKAVLQLAETWRKHASDVEAKLSSFLDLERDLAELIAHSEQLAFELERARPGTPAHKNVSEASRRAVTRMFKVLGAQDVALQQLSAGATGLVEKQAQYAATLQKAIASANEYVASYKASAKAHEEEEAPPEKPRRDRDKVSAAAVADDPPEKPRREKERKEKKERKARSKSPEKSERKAKERDARHL